MRLVVYWANKEDFPIEVYHRGPDGRVILMRGLCENIKMFHHLRPTDVLIAMVVGDYGDEAFTMIRRQLDLYDLPANRTHVLCNHPEQVKDARRHDLSAVLCNHNCFISEETFRYEPRPKKFDAVVNSRLVKYKRTHLARSVPNLAIIAGHAKEDAEYDSLDEIPHTYVNTTRLTPEAVRELLLASHVGLALSASEGACEASSEYLLCGLPVVSTASTGGRDLWYDAENSIICSPNPRSVQRAVSKWLDRYDRGLVRPEEIRARHVRLAESHRERFVSTMARALQQVGSSSDARELIRRDPPTWRFRDPSEVATELSV